MKSTLLLLTLLFLSALCYDTGHHSDLTRNALEVHGYSFDAQRVGAVGNWFVDYYSYTPAGGAIEDLKSMHFDNLHHMLNVSNYMTQLVKNTINATQFAAASGDRVTYLVLLGVSLHAVQDFYTHSSWAEHHQTSCGCYRDETWFDELTAAGGNVTTLFDRLQEVRTYSWGDGCNEFERNCLPGQIPHGGYCEGVNKDSYVRPWFERSYGHSFAASVEWIYNFEQWTIQAAGNSDLINDAKTYSAEGEDAEDLDEDYTASIIVSYATKNPIDGEEDGHYKGAGSGSVKRLAASVAKFKAHDSIYKNKFEQEKVYTYLTYPNLYDVNNYASNFLNLSISTALQYVIPYSSLPSELNTFQKIKIRTTYAAVERVGTPSPYAIIVVNGMEFEEAVMHDQETFKPHWTTIKYVPANTTQVTIQYALWDDKFPTDDKLKDIRGDDNQKLDFVFDIASHELSGEVSGVYDSSDNTFTQSHDNNAVTLFITSEKAGNCVMNGNPEPYCPNEAYTDLRVYSGCEIDVTSGAVTTIVSISSLLLLLLA